MLNLWVSFALLAAALMEACTAHDVSEAAAELNFWLLIFSRSYLKLPKADCL